MFPVYKLERLPAGQRRRKIVMLLTALERSLADSSSAKIYDENDLRTLVRLVTEDPKLDSAALSELAKLLTAPQGSLDCLRACNYARNALLGANGTFPAEWDLIVPEQKLPGGSPPRFFYPGIWAYAEDIRSPFNLGSIFRTAEAFGAEKIIISPVCVPPAHPRAQRSSMGCIDFIPWEQKALESLPEDLPVFALETGGTPIDEFEFPARGVVLIGSEELGLSAEALGRATYGRVSIPMVGIKASLNVGVAFGILMQAWTSYLCCSDSKPF